jgi:hypothetical protein
MKHCKPQVLAEGVGRRWPAPSGPQASSPRASSPQLEQGGTLENLMQGIWQHHSHSPHNRLSTVVVLALPNGFANPTTPAPAIDDRRPPVAPSTVPSGLCPSADAWGSQVPATPTRPIAGRGWSAYADDSGRSAFPLEPPSSAPRRWSFQGRTSLSDGQSAVQETRRLSTAGSAARRHR